MMSESKHTPGPWYPVHVIGPTGNYYAVQIVESEFLEESEKEHRPYNEICHVNMFPPDLDTGDSTGYGLANTRMLASAPALLDLCEEALAWMKSISVNVYGPDAIIKDLEAEISKAKGE